MQGCEAGAGPVGTVFTWGLRDRNRNRLRNTIPVPGARNEVPIQL